MHRQALSILLLNCPCNYLKRHDVSYFIINKKQETKMHNHSAYTQNHNKKSFNFFSLQYIRMSRKTRNLNDKKIKKSKKATFTKIKK